MYNYLLLSIGAFVEVGKNTSLIDCISNVFTIESLMEDTPNPEETILQSSKYVGRKLAAS